MSSRLLPPNSTALERAITDAAQLERLAPEVIATLWDANSCPVANLPWLAWALSVDEWDETWDEATQRRVIAACIAIHRKKGTVGAVKHALTSLGHSGRLIEWWQTTPRGTPHTFTAEVEIGNRGIDAAAVTAIERQIIAVKPVRSHFSLRVIGRSSCAVRVGIAALSGDEVAIQPYQITSADAPREMIHIGIGLYAFGPTTIYPMRSA